MPTHPSHRPVRGAVLGALLLFALAVPSLDAQIEPESHFFTASDGVRIHYLTAGEEGSWVVLVHGYTDSAQRMWFRTGIAPALAERHRVVAIDNRNHGQSDRPQPGGTGRAEDVVELMDHLGIERAHIHGYSMGGGITATLLSLIPERFITAGFGGSGIRETDPELAALAASFDPESPEPTGAAAAAFDNLRRQAASRAPAPSAETTPPPTARPLDLTALDIPMIAINGEYDAPYAKSMRMWREVEIFQNVVLPGENHMTAIMVGGPMPQQYIDSMVGFITTYDEP